MSKLTHRAKLWLKSRLSRLSGRIIGKHVRALIIQSGKYKFAVDPQDIGVGRHLRLRGVYGADELERMSKYYDETSTVVIVGTHVGTIAIPIADQCKRLIAFEANPETFELLSMNMAINQCTTMTAHNLAVSNRECELKFLINQANSGGSKIVPENKTFNYYYDSPKEVTVKGVAGDTLIDAESIDLMVMDIEGSEYFALQGMPRALSVTKTLIVEFVPHHLRDVSGVSVADFLEVIGDFSRLTVPSKGITVERDQFLPTLQKMFDADEDDDGIIFEK
ncbi:FkbM family methyltransferase [Novipirellula caenicola]|uniref:Methyltransferase FkbM domain-containing protein n=1 Tax=Novipirellula caenicola TaxID=1536901 RepID=A0ABP9VNC5_9BACT